MKIGVGIFAVWSIAFISYQKYVQEKIFEAFTSAGAGGEMINVTRIESDRSDFFEWKDRVRVTVASTAFSDVYMAEGPFDVELVLESRFTPFGLYGEVKISESETAVEPMYEQFAKTLKGVEVEYSLNGLFGGLNAVIESDPFAFELNTDEVGVGPVEWQIATHDRFYAEVDVRPDFSFYVLSRGDDLKVKRIDPAGVEKSIELDDFEASGLWVQGDVDDMHDDSRLDRPWFVKKLRLSAEAMKFKWRTARGALGVDMINSSAAVDQRSGRMAVANGTYSVKAQKAEYEIEIFGNESEDASFDVSSFYFKAKAHRLPKSLFETVNPLDVEEILRTSHSFSLKVDSEFNYEDTHGYVYADVYLDRQAKPVEKQSELPPLFWDVKARFPKQAVQMIERVFNSKRRFPLDLDQFMTVEHAGRTDAYKIDFERSSDGGVHLNNIEVR